jgi:hypothetical protein
MTTCRLDRRAREVGVEIGWDLQFVVAPNAEYVGLAAGGGADHAERTGPFFPAGRHAQVLASILAQLPASTVNEVPLVRPKSG